MKLYIEHEIQQKHHTIMSYVIYLHTFAKYTKVSDLVSATLEGSHSQLRALFLEILLSYQMLQPIPTSSISCSEHLASRWK